MHTCTHHARTTYHTPHTQPRTHKPNAAMQPHSHACITHALCKQVLHRQACGYTGTQGVQGWTHTPCVDTQPRSHTATQLHSTQLTQAQAHRHTGTPARRHRGMQACRHAGTHSHPIRSQAITQPHSPQIPRRHAGTQARTHTPYEAKQPHSHTAHRAHAAASQARRQTGRQAHSHAGSHTAT
jgi:hypothetical protein